jgi:hypothetical protein
MERILEVSHWGNIAIEEHISLLHKGAILKVIIVVDTLIYLAFQGSFSRLDYQMDRRGHKQPVVRGFKVNNVSKRNTNYEQNNFRPYCLHLLVTFTIVMKLVTFLHQMFDWLKIRLNLKFGHDFHCLVVGKQTIILDTMFQAMNIYFHQVK